MEALDMADKTPEDDSENDGYYSTSKAFEHDEHDESEGDGPSCCTDLCRGGDDCLQRCWRPGGVAGVATGVLCTVVMMVVTVGSRVFE